MNGPVKMYAMRPIITHGMGVELPECMYRLNNIHQADYKSKNGTDDVSCPNRQQTSDVDLISEKVKQFLKMNDYSATMAALEEKQEVILKQLEALKNQMTSIRNALKECGSNKLSSATCARPNTSWNVKHLPEDITINVNPNNIPYSLLLLQNILKDTVNLKCLVYTHSSVTTLPKGAQDFNNTLTAFGNTNNKPSLTVRLIWKECGFNQFEMCGSRYIQGEVNFLRYVARLTNCLNYNENDCELDSLLDATYDIAHCGTKTERAKLLHRFTKKLARNNYLSGKNSILDVAAYSAIKQSCNINEVNVSLAKWLQNCESVVV